MVLERRSLAGAVIVLCVIGGPAQGRGAVLGIWPQKMSAEMGKYVLLPPQASVTDGDAVALSRKAAQMLPDRNSTSRCSNT